MAAVVIAPADRSAPRRLADPFAGRASAPPQRTTPSVAPVRRLDQAVYRRRRIMVLLAAVAVLGLAAYAAAGVVQGVAAWRTDPSSEPAAVLPGSTASSAAVASDVYLVEPGDTLWSIAERIAPGEDPRPIVYRLAQQTGGASLRPGQRLTLDGVR